MTSLSSWAARAEAAGLRFHRIELLNTSENYDVAFLFSGPKLYPQLEPQWVVIGPLAVVILATLFTMYPALLASRVVPATAMQEKE